MSPRDMQQCSALLWEFVIQCNRDLAMRSHFLCSAMFCPPRPLAYTVQYMGSHCKLAGHWHFIGQVAVPVLWFSMRCGGRLMCVDRNANQSPYLPDSIRLLQMVGGELVVQMLRSAGVM